MAGTLTHVFVSTHTESGSSIGLVSANEWNSSHAFSGTWDSSQITSVTASQITGTITGSQIATVGSSQLTGSVLSSQIASVGSTQINSLIGTSQISVASSSLAFTSSFIQTVGSTQITNSSLISGAPGGPSNAVQFNNAGSFGGSSQFTFNGTNFVGLVPTTGAQGGLNVSLTSDGTFRIYLNLDSADNPYLGFGVPGNDINLNRQSANIFGMGTGQKDTGGTLFLKTVKLTNGASGAGSSTVVGFVNTTVALQTHQGFGGL